MATELTMPQMGYDMQEGTVVRWLKAEGSNVELGEPVAEIETDKAVVEFESYASGVLQTILVEEGSTVPVGQPIAVVGEEAEAPAPAPKPEVEAPVAEPEPEAPEAEDDHAAIPLGASTAEAAPVDGVAEEPLDAPSVSVPDRRIFATPIARQMAFEAGIDLADVEGTGPGGRIVKEDIVRFTESQAAAPTEPEPEVPVVVEAEEVAPVAEEVEAVEPETDTAAEVAAEPEAELEVEEVVVEPEPEPVVASAEEPEPDLIPLSRMRQQIARVTIRSKDEKPHFYVNTDVDMTDAMALRGQINDALADRGVRVTVNDLIVAASVLALKKFPKFNAYYEDGNIRMNDDVNVGIAMALEEGLIMPAVVGAGEMSLAEIAQATKDLAARANQGTLRPEEYSGGTFAVSNMGMMNVTSFVAIIQPPQTAVLAVGAVQKRPVVAADDSIVVRQMMTATLSADHRIVDGAEGAFFINEIKRLLESPLSVIL
ncbi:MAG: dihydrolipoamide acetyltransferase family protein [Dehalococcoidia bacterium]|nr:dihydrolipoamide acetyltransferase family protein [Dehalococcoidia bacterium]